jgi:hypothetical protein
MTISKRDNLLTREGEGGGRRSHTTGEKAWSSVKSFNTRWRAVSEIIIERRRRKGNNSLVDEAIYSQR